MKSALQKAKEETAKKQDRERKYQAEQEQEVKRLQAEQQRQKQVFYLALLTLSSLYSLGVRRTREENANRAGEANGD